MKKILVTGATGFIGERVVKELTKYEYELHCITRSRNKFANDSNDKKEKKIVWHTIDLLNLGQLESLIKDIRPEIIIHLAWHIVPEGELVMDDRNLLWVGVGIRILQVFKEVGGECFVLGGTAMQYRVDNTYPIEEGTSLSNDNFYNACKNSLENISKVYCEMHNIRFIGTRIFNVYGENKNKNKFLPYTIINILNHRPVVCRNGDQVLDLIFVEDVARAIVKLILVEAQGIVNIGTGEPVKLRDVVLKIEQIIGNEGYITFLDKEQQDSKMLVANNRKLVDLTGWVPQYTLEKGLKRMIEYYGRGY